MWSRWTLIFAPPGPERVSFAARAAVLADRLASCHLASYTLWACSLVTVLGQLRFRALSCYACTAGRVLLTGKLSSSSSRAGRNARCMAANPSSARREEAVGSWPKRQHLKTRCSYGSTKGIVEGASAFAR